MVEITLPIPAFLSYFWKNATVRTKNGMSGAMMLVLESPMRYATWVSSGERPSRINMGTKIGAMIAHFALSTAIKMLMKAVRMMKQITSGSPTKPMSLRKFAPDTEMMVPRLE